MAQKSDRLPIERGFPIERVDEIAQKESRAKMYYRPIYTMHKWWARRHGCTFRAIALYSLLDNPEDIEAYEPRENGTLDDFDGGRSDIQTLIETVDMSNPESLWGLYSNDVRIEDKKILDPFMGGGTSLVEASRFGAEVDGYDLNPVAWFTTKKELDASQTDVEELEAAFEQVKEDVSDEILDYYKTPCPNGDHDADVMYNFWVKEVDCVSCGYEVPLFKDYRVAKGRFENDDKYNVLCPDCGSIILVDDWREDCACSECSYEFVPQEGNVSRGGKYACPDCGQKYGITDAIQEQNGHESRLYGIEYYCEHCDDRGEPKSAIKGYKRVETEDLRLYDKAVSEWQDRDDLNEYVPSESIREGWYTASTKFNGSAPGAHDVHKYDYTRWKDMFTERQLLSLAKLLQAIDHIENQNIQELLLLAVSGSLRYTNHMVGYHHTRNHIHDLFKTNSFDPPTKPTEGNVWGSKYGLGTFSSTVQGIIDGVEYAKSPTERYVEDGETVESEPFSQPIGENTTVHQGDARLIDAQGEYDAVITDPPYYDNIMYSELSDYFYVWQKLLLEDEYDAFEHGHTPRAESIVANPAENKDADVFESELYESFSVIHEALKDDGVLVFTYHHSDSESWGELLESLCEVGFEVTATYPVSADINKFTSGEAIEFDIITVARPAGNRQPISWNSLRRNIVRTAKQTHQRLTENRDLSDGNIGVIEMGRAFHEYSKHHGEVRKDGGIMTAKEVVEEIYGIIQQGSDIGEVDVFLDLLEMNTPGYNDLNKLSRGTGANPERMNELFLYRMEAGEFVLGTWDDEKRQAFIQDRVNSSDDSGLTPLDKAQFLRHRFERGKSIQNYLEQWNISDDLRELSQELAEASGDDVYRRILGGDRGLGNY